MRKNTPNNVSGRELRRRAFKQLVHGVAVANRAPRRAASQFIQAEHGIDWRTFDIVGTPFGPVYGPPLPREMEWKSDGIPKGVRGE